MRILFVIFIVGTNKGCRPLQFRQVNLREAQNVVERHDVHVVALDLDVGFRGRVHLLNRRRTDLSL